MQSKVKKLEATLKKLKGENDITEQATEAANRRTKAEKNSQPKVDKMDIESVAKETEASTKKPEQVKTATIDMSEPELAPNVDDSKAAQHSLSAEPDAITKTTAKVAEAKRDNTSSKFEAETENASSKPDVDFEGGEANKESTASKSGAEKDSSSTNADADPESAKVKKESISSEQDAEKKSNSSESDAEPENALPEKQSNSSEPDTTA